MSFFEFVPLNSTQEFPFMISHYCLSVDKLDKYFPLIFKCSFVGLRISHSTH